MDAMKNPEGANPENVTGKDPSRTEESRGSTANQLSAVDKRKADEETEFKNSVRQLIRMNGGPSTQRGKERSRRNAVKHGIFAKVVLLDSEPNAQFDALLRGLRDDLRPVGTIEEILVEKLASITWRYRRMLFTERAEIKLEKRFNSRTAERRNHDENIAAILDASEGITTIGLYEHWHNPHVRSRIIDMLESLRVLITGRGFAFDEDAQILRRLCGIKQASLLLLYTVYENPGKLGSEIKELNSPENERRLRFLDLLKEEIDRLKSIDRLTETLGDVKERLEERCSGVPEPARLDGC